MTYKEFTEQNWKTVYAQYVEEYFNHPTEEEMYEILQDKYQESIGGKHSKA